MYVAKFVEISKNLRHTWTKNKHVYNYGCINVRMVQLQIKQTSLNCISFDKIIILA